MSEIITAIYENGVLRPLAPLDLPEQAQVEIEVRPLENVPPEAARQREAIRRALADAGLLANDPATGPFPENPISDEEQARLGRLFAEGRPLSEIILEEREERF